MVSKSADPLTRDRGFESGSLLDDGRSAASRNVGPKVRFAIDSPLDVPADPVTHCAIAGARTSVRGPGIKCNGQRRLRCGLMKANQRVPAPRGRRTHSFGSTWRRSRGKLLLWMFLQPDNSVRRCRNWKMPVETAFTGLHIRGRTYCPGATTALISGECRLKG
jgi:hypothetical protein